MARRYIIDWDKVPEKMISDRLAALWLMLQHYEEQLPKHVRANIADILETDNPKALKYHWWQVTSHQGERPADLTIEEEFGEAYRNYPEGSTESET